MTFEFFGMLTNSGHSNDIRIRLSLPTATSLYVSLPVTPAGCRVMVFCCGTHITSLSYITPTKHNTPRKNCSNRLGCAQLKKNKNGGLYSTEVNSKDTINFYRDSITSFAQNMYYLNVSFDIFCPYDPRYTR